MAQARTPIIGKQNAGWFGDGGLLVIYDAIVIGRQVPGNDLI